MRDFTSCFTEYAVQVSETSCSGSTQSDHSISPESGSIISVQNSVTCVYRTVLPSQKLPALIACTWCRDALFQGLSVSFLRDGDGYDDVFRLNTNSRMFKKLRGTKSLDLRGLTVEIFWDLSSSRYGSGPEPVDGYCVAIVIGSDPGLILGCGPARDSFVRKLKCRAVKSTLISRREEFAWSGGVYATKARFAESGPAHDIVIRCGGPGEGLKHPVLSVCVDRKTVIRVNRLHWNFRGNQTIFLDGLLVDLMWDVHGWFHGSVSGSGSGSGIVPGFASFMFRTRSGMDSRLWLEEKLGRAEDEDKVGFSLMILGCKKT